MLMQFGTMRPSMFQPRFPIDFLWGHLGFIRRVYVVVLFMLPRFGRVGSVWNCR